MKAPGSDLQMSAGIVVAQRPEESEPEVVHVQLRDMVLRAAARSNLPIRWLPDRLAEQNFAIGEPPSKASPWVRVLMGHLQSLRQRLDGQAGLTPADVTEVRLLTTEGGPACLQLSQPGSGAHELPADIAEVPGHCSRARTC